MYFFEINVRILRRNIFLLFVVVFLMILFIIALGCHHDLGPLVATLFSLVAILRRGPGFEPSWPWFILLWGSHHQTQPEHQMTLKTEWNSQDTSRAWTTSFGCIYSSFLDILYIVSCSCTLNANFPSKVWLFHDYYICGLLPSWHLHLLQFSALCKLGIKFSKWGSIYLFIEDSSYQFSSWHC